MPAGGLEALEARIAERLAKEVPSARFARREAALTVSDALGRPCVELTLDLEMRDTGRKGSPPYVHRGVRWWCPASPAEGSPIVRLGFFEYHRADDPPRRDFLPDVQAMVRSLAFTRPEAP